MKSFGGRVLFLDRSNINTDEIIPAKYLTEVTKKALKPHLLEDFELNGFNPEKDALQKSHVIVTRSNFGCGSSREHAPWALEQNNITVVIAENFARIFRQNMFNCGMLAIELPSQKIDEIFSIRDKGIIECLVNNNENKIVFRYENNTLLSINYKLNDFDNALVKVGGWLEYADKKY